MIRKRQYLMLKLGKDDRRSQEFKCPALNDTCWAEWSRPVFIAMKAQKRWTWPELNALAKSLKIGSDRIRQILSWLEHRKLAGVELIGKDAHWWVCGIYKEEK